MKALSLPQPFASLWLTGPKVHDTRVWRIHHRGWLLVHASQTVVRPRPHVAATAARLFGKDWAKTLPRGAIIGAVYVVDCEPTGMARKHSTFEDLMCGDFSPGRWAVRRSGPTMKLATPVPMRGNSRLFEVDTTVVPELSASIVSSNYA